MRDREHERERERQREGERERLSTCVQQILAERARALPLSPDRLVRLAIRSNENVMQETHDNIIVLRRENLRRNSVTRTGSSASIVRNRTRPRTHWDYHSIAPCAQLSRAAWPMPCHDGHGPWMAVRQSATAADNVDAHPLSTVFDSRLSLLLDLVVLS